MSNIAAQGGAEENIRYLCLVLLRNTLEKEGSKLTDSIVSHLKPIILNVHGSLPADSKSCNQCAGILASLVNRCLQLNISASDVFARLEDKSNVENYYRSTYLLQRMLEFSNISSQLVSSAGDLTRTIESALRHENGNIRIQGLFAMTAVMKNPSSDKTIVDSFAPLGQLALFVALQEKNVTAINALDEVCARFGNWDGSVPVIMSHLGSEYILSAKAFENIDLLVACLSLIDSMVQSMADEYLKNSNLCDGILSIGCSLLEHFDIGDVESLQKWAEEDELEDAYRVETAAATLVVNASKYFPITTAGRVFAAKIQQLIASTKPQSQFAALRVASAVVQNFPDKVFRTEIPSIFQMCKAFITGDALALHDPRIVWAAMAVHKEIFDAYSPKVQRQAKMGADLPNLVDCYIRICHAAAANVSKPGVESVLFQALITLQAAFPTDEEEEARQMTHAKDLATLKPLLEILVADLIAPLVQHPSISHMCKARALELLASFVTIYHSSFVPKFNETVELVKQIFSGALHQQTDGSFQMAEACVTLVGNMCQAVPKDVFMPHAVPLMNILQIYLDPSLAQGADVIKQDSAVSVASLGGDTMARAILQTLMVIAGTMGSEFAPYLKMMMPSITQKASKCDAYMALVSEDSIDPSIKIGTPSVGVDGKISQFVRVDNGQLLHISFNQFSLDETLMAVTAIGDLSFSMGHEFLPHLISAMNALGQATLYPLASVRAPAMSSVGEVLTNTLRVPLNGQNAAFLVENPDAFEAPDTATLVAILNEILTTHFKPAQGANSFLKLGLNGETNDVDDLKPMSLMGSILSVVSNYSCNIDHLNKYALKSLLTAVDAISLAVADAAGRGPEHSKAIADVFDAKKEGIFFEHCMRVCAEILDFAMETMEKNKTNNSGGTVKNSNTAATNQDDEDDEDDEDYEYDDNATDEERVVDSVYQIVSAVLKIVNAAASPTVKNKIFNIWIEDLAKYFCKSPCFPPSGYVATSSSACLVAGMLAIADFIRLSTPTPLATAVGMLHSTHLPLVDELATNGLHVAIAYSKLDDSLLAADAEIGNELMLCQAGAYLLGAIVEVCPQVAGSKWKEASSALVHTLTVCNSEDYRILLDTAATSLLKMTAVGINQNGSQSIPTECADWISFLLSVDALPIREETVEAVIGNDLVLTMIAYQGLGVTWGAEHKSTLQALLNNLNENKYLVSSGSRLNGLIEKAAAKLI